jgi:hypothetical protein
MSMNRRPTRQMCYQPGAVNDVDLQKSISSPTGFAANGVDGSEALAG